MKITIFHNTQDDNYIVQIYDGPDGLDHADFICGSLGECFEQIMQFRIFNRLSYGEADPGTTLEKYFESLDDLQ